MLAALQAGELPGLQRAATAAAAGDCTLYELEALERTTRRDLSL